VVVQRLDISVHGPYRSAPCVRAASRSTRVKGPRQTADLCLEPPRSEARVGRSGIGTTLSSERLLTKDSNPPSTGPKRQIHPLAQGRRIARKVERDWAPMVGVRCLKTLGNRGQVLSLLPGGKRLILTKSATPTRNSSVGWKETFAGRPRQRTLSACAPG
jgi:hypothetical protein